MPDVIPQVASAKDGAYASLPLPYGGREVSDNPAKNSYLDHPGNSQRQHLTPPIITQVCSKGSQSNIKPETIFRGSEDMLISK